MATPRSSSTEISVDNHQDNLNAPVHSQAAITKPHPGEPKPQRPSKSKTVMDSENVDTNASTSTSASADKMDAKSVIPATDVKVRNVQDSLSVSDLSTIIPSSSRSRKRSEEETESLKRTKQSFIPTDNISGSSINEPEPTGKTSNELTILDYMDRVLNKHTKIINENIDSKHDDTMNRIAKLEDEVEEG